MATYKYYIKTGVNGETQEVNFNAVDSSTIEGKTLEQIKTELSTLETPISIKGVDENGSPTVIECDSVEEAITQLNEADNVITVTLDNTINNKEQALNIKINNTNKSLDDTNKNLNNTTNLLNKLVDFIGYVENSGIEFRDVIADFTDGKLDNEDFHALIEDYYNDKLAPNFESINSDLMGHLSKEAFEEFLAGIFTDVKTETEDNSKGIGQLELDITDLKNTDINNIKVDINNITDNLKDKITLSDAQSASQALIEQEFDKFNTERFNPTIKDISDLIDTKLNGDEVDSKISDFDKTKLQPVTEILNSKLDSDAVDLKISNFETNKINPINTLLNSKLDEAGVSSVFDNKIGSFKETDMQPAINDAVNAFKTGDFADLSAIVDTKVTSGDIDDKITSFKNGDLNTIFTDKLSGINSDLANKLTQSDVTNILSDFETSKLTPISNALSSKISRTDTESLIATAVGDKITSTQLNTALADKITNDAFEKFKTDNNLEITSVRELAESRIDSATLTTTVNNAVANKVTQTAMNEALADKISSETFNSALAGKVNTSIYDKFVSEDFESVKTSLGNKLNTADFTTFKTTGEFKGLSDLVDTKLNSDDVDSKISNFDTSKIKPITEILEGKLDTDGVNSLISNFETNKIKPITDELATKLGETDVNGLIDTKITAFDTNTISAIRTDLSSKINRTDTESLISTAVGDKVTSTQLSNALKDKLDSTQVGSAIDNKLSSFKTTEVTPIMTIIGSSTDGVDKDTLFGKIAKNDNSLNSFIDGDFTTLSNTVGNKLDLSTFNTFKTTGEFKTLSDSVASKADSSTTYTKTDVDNKVSTINTNISTINTTLGNKANTSDVYVKTEIDTKVNTINTNIGTKANVSDVYNKTKIDELESSINSSFNGISNQLNGKASTSTVTTISNKLTNILDSSDNTKVKYSSIPTNIQDIIEELNVGNSTALDEYVHEGIYLIKYREGTNLVTAKTNYAILMVERESRSVLPIVQGAKISYTVKQTLYGENVKTRSGTITCTCTSAVQMLDGPKCTYSYSTFEGVA